MVYADTFVNDGKEVCGKKGIEEQMMCYSEFTSEQARTVH
jgi:hypothetical protein